MLTVGRPTILVVMHHTEDRKDAVDESRLLVDDTNVHLTVDVLFRAGKLHGRKVNRKAWEEVGLFIAQSYPSYVNRVIIYSSNTVRLTHNQFQLSHTANNFIIKSLTIVTYTFSPFLPSFWSIPGMTSTIVSVNHISYI